MTSGRKGSADKTIPHTRLEDESMIRETYEMGRKLGQGSFGKVYEVTHKSTGIHWAMKTINKEKAGSSAMKLLEREVAILKRVTHGNIIQLNEVFETSKKMFLIMELCEGGELADALKERKYFMESEVKVITKELASAIAYLHKNDIVHRDMKLENILISKVPDATNPEDKLQIKVTDFGLSITKTGVGHDNMMQDFCGTPNYMSPEIIDNKTYSQQCDIWALGIIVYSLFCGYPPFRSKDEDSLYDMIKKGEVDFSSDDTWNEVSPEAKHCIQKMLNVDPAHRITASELLDDPWITGNQDRKSTNVLQLMKEWKDDLKNNVDNDSDNDTSAIQNGQLSPAEGGSEVGDEATTEETSGADPQASTDTGRKGSGGTKKPGSGGKNSTRTGARLSVGSIPRSSVANALKASGTAPRVVGSRSPMPKVTGTNTGQYRPTTQGSSSRPAGAATTNSSNKPVGKTMTSTRPTAKGTPSRK